MYFDQPNCVALCKVAIEAALQGANRSLGGEEDAAAGHKADIACPAEHLVVGRACNVQMIRTLSGVHDNMSVVHMPRLMQVLTQMTLVM